MPGLVHANSMISRDEGSHVRFACLLYSLLRQRVEREEVYGMLREAVAIERAFFAGK